MTGAMTMDAPPPSVPDLTTAARRFDAALRRLEASLGSAVNEVADLARRTGHEDGFAEGLAQGRAEGWAEAAASAGADGQDDPGAPLLREQLAAARAREQALDRAVEEARAALDEAIEDIRATLGQV